MPDYMFLLDSRITAEQREAIALLDGPVLVVAGAGSVGSSAGT